VLAAEVRNGRLVTIHGLDPNRARAVGSAFKLYVLGALGQAIENGTASWQEKLAIRNAWKSIPSGVMQNEPGREALHAPSLRTADDRDQRQHRGRPPDRALGRTAVEQELVRFGNHSPGRDIPFLTTRENTILRRRPGLADERLRPEPARKSARAYYRASTRSALDRWALGKPRSAGSLAWMVEDKRWR